MKVTIETENGKEALRMQKSLDMACFIFEIARNSGDIIEHKCYSPKSEYNISVFFEHVNELLDKYNINIDELLD
jgi:hypothetical protein